MALEHGVEGDADGERAGRAPLVSLRLFAERPFSIGITLVVVAYAGVNSFFLILSLMLQDGLGMSALGAGLEYTPLAVAFFATSLLAARWTPRELADEVIKRGIVPSISVRHVGRFLKDGRLEAAQEPVLAECGPQG